MDEDDLPGGDEDGAMTDADLRPLLSRIEAVFQRVGSEKRALALENGALRAELALHAYADDSCRAPPQSCGPRSSGPRPRCPAARKSARVQPSIVRVRDPEDVDEFVECRAPALDEPVSEYSDSEEDTPESSKFVLAGPLASSAVLEQGMPRSTSNWSNSGVEQQPMQLLQVWAKREVSRQSTVPARGFSTSRSSSLRRLDSSYSTANLVKKRRDHLRSGDAMTSDSCWQRFVSRPSSPRRAVWDVISVACMAYDLIAIPLHFFNLPDTPEKNTLMLLTTCFWTVDILMSFFAGYHNGGVIEMRPQRVALRYLRTWFPLDIAVVVVDWVMMVIVGMATQDGAGVLRLNKSLRIVRMLRLLRLLRTFKVVAVARELTDLMNSEEVLTCVNISQFIIGIMLLNHYIACCWYGVGMSQVSDSRDSWVLRLQANSQQEIGFGYYYTTALHWSLTQFTPASMEVVPANTVERLFTVAVVMMAVVLFSSLLSSITTSMINLRRNSAAKKKQEAYVRRYIIEKQVTLDLGNRILGFLRQHNYNVNQRQALQEDQIASFKILPESLRKQLVCEIFVPPLIGHPLFRTINKLDEAAIVSLCTTGMSEKNLAIGQERFHCGQMANHMYISTTGNLVYFTGHDVDDWEDVCSGTFISEAALWLCWEHKGRLVAMESAAAMVALSASAFQESMQAIETGNLCREYATKFHEEQVKLDQDQPHRLTDIRFADDGMVRDMVKEAFAAWQEDNADFRPMSTLDSAKDVESCLFEPQGVRPPLADRFFARVSRLLRPKASS